MNQELLNNWLSAINNSRCSRKLKVILLQYVNDILQKEGVVIINTSHLAQLIGLSEEIMNKMINSPNSFYRSFTIPKRSGGERIIFAPYPSLMCVQKWIYNNILLPGIVVSDSAMGFVRGKSILDNVAPHVGRKEFLKMDIKDFFRQ